MEVIYIDEVRYEKRYRNAKVYMIHEKSLLKKDKIKKPRISWVRNTTDYQQILKPKKKSGGYTAPIIATIVAIIVIIVFICIFGKTPPNELSPYSTDWNDISKFKNDLEGEGYTTGAIVSTPHILKKTNRMDVKKTAIFIIGVERRYSEDEVNALIDFINKGGRVVVADDFGYGNSIAAYFKARFLGGHLWDKNYIKNPKFVQVTVNPISSEEFYFSGRIILNEATALELSNEYAIFARSSENSWVDMDDDGRFDPYKERYKAYPVGAYVRIGDGLIVLISDPSIFINDMVDKGDNLRFIKELTHFLLPEGGEVIFDESSHFTDSFETAIAKEFYYIIAWLTLDPILIAILFISLLLIFGLLIINSEMPPKLTHRFSIDDKYIPKTVTMAFGINPEDEEYLRDIIRKAVIISHKLEYDADDYTIADFIKHRRVREFFLGKRFGISQDEAMDIFMYTMRMIRRR